MIKVEKLDFTYPGATEATIKGLDFEVEKGEVFGFLGPSGSGKSTTQKILYRLLKGYSGNIMVVDKPLGQWGREYYERIGVSFELPNHYLKLTARENLKFFSSFYKGECKNIDALLEQVGLLEDADKRVEEFSKGMKMRLNFIRALIHEPILLFLDEPTSGLDPINARKIKDMIMALKEKGCTVFITTHNMTDADQLCDRIALLDYGQIVALEKPSALKLTYGQRKVKVGAMGKEHEFTLDGLGQNAAFMELLQSNTISTIHSEEATLEDVFVKLTGKKLV